MAVIHQLYRTFKDILSKSGGFSTPKSLEGSAEEMLTLQRFSSVLFALLSVLRDFEVL